MAETALETYLARWRAEGVPLVALVAHGIHSLKWLADHAGDSFCLSYTDQTGLGVVEKLTAARMLARCSELGWTPMIADAPGQFLCFEDAIYSRYRGVHWFATEYDEETALPLALPEHVREAARRRAQAYKARLDRRLARERQARERERLKRERNEDAKLIASLADDAELRAARAGRPINRREAKKRGKKLWRDITEGIAAEMAKLKATPREHRP